MQYLNPLAPREPHSEERAREYVERGRKERRSLVIRQPVPAYAFTRELGTFLLKLWRSPTPLQLRLERQKAHVHARRGEPTQVRQNLRLHQRLAQPEVAEVESAD